MKYINRQTGRQIDGGASLRENRSTQREYNTSLCMCNGAEYQREVPRIGTLVHLFLAFDILASNTVADS